MPGPERSVRPRNPYLNRVMIREVSDFYGRRREAAKIFARIGAARPQSVAIVGDRRIGKSSLLHYLCQPEIRRHYLDDPEAYTFVLIDLQEQREIGIPAFFENLFHGIEQALGRTRRPGLPADYETARRALVRLQEEGRKIVLLFDEFDAITRNPNFPEEFFSFLRAVANKYDVAYVTTSGRDLQQLCHAERIADSPFFNIFSNLFLTRFEPEEARALIREPSDAAGIPLAPYTADIIDLAGLFPFFIQVACSTFFEQLAEEGGLDLDVARASFLEEAEPHFKYIIDHFDDDQRRVFQDLVEDRPVPPSRSYLLSKLKRDGYLLNEDGRDRLFSSAFAACIGDGRFTRVAAPPQPPMSPERWRQIEPLFHAALQREGSERAAFLNNACAGDDALRREVESLLAQQVSGDGLRTGAALAAGAGGVGPSFSSGATATGTGRRLGVYHLQTLLGAGGMGEVYRARDTKLGRDVAIKVLPAVFSTDPERLARFEREAHLLAALNHPHIGAIYGIEESGGSRGLVLELVEGSTLADGVRSGPLAVREALAIARQIADALAAAHQKGIVHRDLKPANIKVTPGGVVKVLDFGLAKVWAGEAGGLDLSRSPTLSGFGTRAGVLLGTVAYMSPEQARGKAVDNRTDIWSFGCVVFEVLSGRAPFAGDTVSDTIARILEREPDWQLLPGATPARVRDLLRRCLQKDPNQRLHDIADARIELDELLAVSPRGGRVLALLARLSRLVAGE